MMMACSKLNTRDLSKVRNEVLSAAAKWYDIGLELGMSVDYLDTVKKENDDQKDCLREMLRQWLSGVDPEPSWESLVAALRIPVVNYPALASEIELKFCGVSVESIENQMQPIPLHPNCVTDNELATQQSQSQSTTIPEPVDVLNDQPSTKTRPVPKPHHSKTLSVDDPWKRELVQSLEDATSSEVTQDLVEKAEKCIKHSSERYNLLEFEKILNENQVR